MIGWRSQWAITPSTVAAMMATPISWSRPCMAAHLDKPPALGNDRPGGGARGRPRPQARSAARSGALLVRARHRPSPRMPESPTATTLAGTAPAATGGLELLDWLVLGAY